MEIARRRGRKGFLYKDAMSSRLPARRLAVRWVEDPGRGGVVCACVLHPERRHGWPPSPPLAGRQVARRLENVGLCFHLGRLFCRRGLGTSTTKRRLHTRTCTTGSPGRCALRRTGSPPVSIVPRVERRHGGQEIVAEESAMLSRPEGGRWRQRCRELHHGDDADDGRMISTGGSMITRRHVRGRLSEFISVCRVPRARIEAGLGSKSRLAGRNARMFLGAELRGPSLCAPEPSALGSQIHN